MSLLTELNSELLTESGLPLLAENETASGGSACALRGKATLQLIARAALRSHHFFTPLSIKAKAALRITTQGLLSKLKTLKAKAALRLLARHGIAQPPSGLGMKMKIIADPYRPDVILDQVLQVWFNGHPGQCRIALKIDDAAEFEPAFTWQNPGVTHPAIVKIDSAAMAGDSKDHQIKVSVWQAIAERTSARATLSDSAKTPVVRPTTQPEWCGATTLRQGETLYSAPYIVSGRVKDLTRIEWRHSGAVQIMAKMPVRTKTASGNWVWKTRVITLGYADHNETRFVVEDLGLLMGWQNGVLHEVGFGVASIHQGQFGPVTWANPVQIREALATTSGGEEPSPDEAAGTARKVTGHLDIRAYPGTFNLEVRARVLTHLGALPTNGNAIIDQTLYHLFLAIKNRIRQGGSVTLDDLGRFEARWNAHQTTRSLSFVASPGFVGGTRAGRVLTDAQAKALTS